MSDITEGINCNIVSFADDTRLYSAINSVTDCDDLQADLENIYKWADTNNMKLILRNSNTLTLVFILKTRIVMYMLDRILT